MGFWKSLGNLSATIVASLVFILLAVLYFMLTMWVIKIGAYWAGYKAVEGNMVVLTAGIITAAITIGAAIQH